MRNIAIICEYNPFHNGHKEQIDRIRAAFEGERVRVISLMSGSFVQRGEPACIQKYKRAEFAINNGSDLVIELPYPAPCSSAEAYAMNAVSYLDLLGDIDMICFGSESGNEEMLTLAANRLLSAGFAERMKKAATEDFASSYAALRSALYFDMYGDMLPDSPNDILAVEYLKSLIRLSSKIRPLVIKRTSAFSATASRKADEEGKDLSELVPDDVRLYLENNKSVRFADLEDYIIPFLMTARPGDLANCRDVNYDLAVKLINAAKVSRDICAIEDMVSDKRYTRARVRRAVISCILRDRDDGNARPEFGILLGANGSGREYMAEHDASAISLYTKRSEIRNPDILKAFDKMTSADAVYNYILRKKGVEIIKKPFII